MSVDGSNVRSSRIRRREKIRQRETERDRDREWDSSNNSSSRDSNNNRGDNNNNNNRDREREPNQALPPPPQRKKVRRDNNEPSNLIDLTGDVDDRRIDRISPPTSLGPSPFSRFESPRIFHLIQHITAPPWNIIDSEHFQEKEPDTFEDLSGGYWARRRKKQAKELRKKKKNEKTVLDLIDDSSEELPKSIPSTSTSTPTSTPHTSNSSTPTTTTPTVAIHPLNVDSTPGDAKSCRSVDASTESTVEFSSLLKNVKCTVCISPLEDVTASVCGHIFCEGCIMQAIKTQGKCPICRRPLNERSIHPLFL